MSMPELFSIGINIKKDYLFYAVKKKKKITVPHSKIIGARGQ